LRRLLGRLVCFAIILAIAAPAVGATSRRAVQCGGHIRPGGRASCSTSFRIPHFNARDTFDYNKFVARIVSPEAAAWRVAGAIYDARGVLYFTWNCSAQRSSVTAVASTYAGHSCETSRKTVRVRRNGRTYTEYYVADTRKAQRLVVSAVVGTCAPTGMKGCKFEGRAVYKLAG
jgi:hypothetical protein